MKISITLPNQVVITIEADEAEQVREVIHMVLRELPAELAQISTGSPPPTIPKVSTPLTGQERTPPAQEAKSEQHDDPAAREQLAQFCRRIDPIGDMRRIVVAATAASDCLGMQSVSVRELGSLFDMAGWPRSADFVQTLRNAARSKFRWLERTPGRPGYYSVTSKGKEVVIGTVLR